MNLSASIYAGSPLATLVIEIEGQSAYELQCLPEVAEELAARVNQPALPVLRGEMIGGRDT